MITLLIVAVVSFVAGGVVSYFFVKKNPATITRIGADVNTVASTVSNTVKKL